MDNSYSCRRWKAFGVAMIFFFFLEVVPSVSNEIVIQQM